MIVPDINLLLYAHDASSPHHPSARAWWEDALSGHTPIGIPWVVVLGFTRLATHPALSVNPMTITQVREIVDAWLEHEHVRLLSPGPQTITLFYDALERVGSGGNFSTDAMIAALAIEYGGRVHSNDADFGRFPDLTWENPLKR